MVTVAGSATAGTALPTKPTVEASAATITTRTRVFRCITGTSPDPSSAPRIHGPGVPSSRRVIFAVVATNGQVG
jgi:hypothetical protein